MSVDRLSVQIILTLTKVGPANDLSQKQIQAHNFVLVANFFLEAFYERHGVGRDDLLELALGNTVTCWAREDTMSNESIHVSSTLVLKSLRCSTKRASSISHVIYYDALLAANIADQDHLADLIRCLALFADHS